MRKCISPFHHFTHPPRPTLANIKFFCNIPNPALPNPSSPLPPNGNLLTSFFYIFPAPFLLNFQHFPVLLSTTPAPLFFPRQHCFFFFSFLFSTSTPFFPKPIYPKMKIPITLCIIPDFPLPNSPLFKKKLPFSFPTLV